ncbi:IS3 family transposase [Streptomyces sp. NPDC006285]|uniref:IS3 family transposase n=1 Tax=Streptomyces sp. NPDC006285 TaxID=3364742 RepID=UPI003691E5B9
MDLSGPGCLPLRLSPAPGHCRRLRRTSREEERTAVAIRQIHAGHQGAHGSPRVHAELRSHGRSINRKHVSGSVRANRIAGRNACGEGSE